MFLLLAGSHSSIKTISSDNPRKTTTVNLHLKGDIFAYTRSNDAKKIAIITVTEKEKPKRKTAISHLYLYDRRTKDTQLLRSFTGLVGSPDWSPDGQRIAFDYDTQKGGVDDIYEEQSSDIYTIDIFKNSFTQLTESPGSEYMPKWSADGTKLAYLTDKDGAVHSGEKGCPKSSICSVDTTRSENMQVIFDSKEKLDIAQIDWSPDGSKIAFSAANTGDVATSLYLVNPDGSATERITSGEHNIDLNPSWSPDSSQLVFQRSILGKGSSEDLYIIKQNDLSVHQLTHTKTIIESLPVWYQ